MSIRTYVRTLFNDVFKRNFFIKAFVNIYYNSKSEAPKNIKFSENLSKLLMDDKKSISFQSVTGDKIDCQ